ncbi:Phosphoenolpyruvate synthase [Variovorax sp. PBL-H6]|uniref:PEP/pyruvate-binding domain-containing protein n=1 Tax=Variovorax sp. PBL-H6 TaxID=434009 RepID=UPI001317DC13|nr:PEP/pyruvate-binding domain-containing protein [Variovorax sp. PBL-H6]VTU34523.1 Phosphoenolpyruvate synthase [Variovorax sp. PBL-H6]
MPGKYNQIKKLGVRLAVPPLTAVTEQDLAAWWENHGAMRHAIERILTTINVTSSAFLDEHLDELQSVIRPLWRPEAQELLGARLREAGLGFDEPLAVRSSCSVEDAYDHSYAGLFVTRLNVQGARALEQAIEDVWASCFGRAALIERLRSGSLTAPSEMTVILQRMVQAAWAGVAFSHDPVSREPLCIVEAVSGCGDVLVSGEVRGVRAQVDGDRVTPELDRELTALFRSVANLVEQVVAIEVGEPTDVEWAHDGTQLWLLQARPITTIGNAREVRAPVCEIVPLYGATDEEIEAFKPLPDFAQYFRSKRKPMADFAQRLGLPAATALLIRANRAGLDESMGTELMRRFRQPQQLLDLSSRVRQLTVSREQVIARLRELLGPAPSTFVLRDFVRGEGGLITQVARQATEADGVLCEWSPEGLLAINRGTASTVTFMLDIPADVETGSNPIGAPAITTAQRLLLYRATRQAQVEFGRVQLEWVSDGGQLYIIDYSLLDAIGTPPEKDGTRIISAGYASGVPVVVDASRDIEQLSIAACVSLTDIPSPAALGALVARLHERILAHDGPVIVVSPRPYAALAPLVPFAAGFVFEQASTLCHLAILLREHGVPAVESLPLYQQALASRTQRLTVNSSALIPS